MGPTTPNTTTNRSFSRMQSWIFLLPRLFLVLFSFFATYATACNIDLRTNNETSFCFSDQYADGDFACDIDAKPMGGFLHNDNDTEAWVPALTQPYGSGLQRYVLFRGTAPPCPERGYCDNCSSDRIPEGAEPVCFVEINADDCSITRGTLSSLNLTEVRNDETLDYSVAGLVERTNDLSTLTGLLANAGLLDTLRGENSGPFTLFAPTNEAFDKLTADVLDALTDNIDALVDVLTYHVVGDQMILSTDLAEGATATALNQETLTVTSLDPPMIDDSIVVLPDLLAANGVIHWIDYILIPDMEEEEEENTNANAMMNTNNAMMLNANAMNMNMMFRNTNTMNMMNMNMMNMNMMNMNMMNMMNTNMMNMNMMNMNMMNMNMMNMMMNANVFNANTGGGGTMRMMNTRIMNMRMMNMMMMMNNRPNIFAGTPVQEPR